MEDMIKIFTEYVKNFDLKEPAIMNKFHHSFRVMEFARDIAISLDLDAEDIMLASIIGLFHDIGRFEQWTKYKTFEDSISVDHGDLSVEILESLMPKITDNEYLKNIIISSVKNHNKFKIEGKLDARGMIMAKLVRDADKLDIMTEQGNILKRNHEVNEKLVDYLKEHKMINNEDVKNEMDSLFRLIGFIFDLNFKYSISYVLDNDIVKNKINLIEIYSGVELRDLEKNLITYLKEEYHVREKI